MKKPLSLLATLLLIPACGQSDESVRRPKAPIQISDNLLEIKNEPGVPVPEEKPIIYTAKEISALMGPGINMGNVFERGGNANSIAATKSLLDLYRSRKIGHVRIPVTWMFDGQKSLDWSVEDDLAGPIADAKGHINTSHKRFEALRDTIDYALEQNLFVILNVHHERDLKAKYDASETYNQSFTQLWNEITLYFQDRYAGKAYAYRLLFEVLNEPEGAFGDFKKSEGIAWNDKVGIDLTRKINEIGYSAIRSLDSNRIILVSPNTQSNVKALSLVYPNDESLPGEHDDRLMVSVHTYDPWNFAGQEGGNSNVNNSMDQVKEFIKLRVGELATWSQTNQTPIHVGEFGVGRLESTQTERNTDVVRSYFHSMAYNLAAHGFVPTVWDDQGWFGITKPDDIENFPFGLMDSYIDGFQDGLTGQ